MAVTVTAYDPDWAHRFEALKAVLMPGVAPFCLSIEHVGSTSVEGLPAKPVIDLDIIIPDAASLPPVIAGLATLGYEHRGDLGIAGREAFRRPPDTFPHNLYVCVRGCVALHNHLTLRDHLRANAADRQRYGELKQALAQKHADDIDSYVEGKTAFILGILAQHGFDDTQLDDIDRANRKPAP